MLRCIILRLSVIVAGTALVAACAPPPSWWPAAATAAPTAAVASHSYRFDWVLSGDPAVAPLQVFDDGRRTWLQFAQDQAAPALFGRTAGGEQLLHAQAEGAYLRLDGVWPTLVFRGGRLQALAQRPEAASVEAPASLVLPPDTDRPASAQEDAPGLAAPSAAAAAIAPASAVQVLAVDDGGRVQPAYDLRLDDRTLRQALARWSRLAGWTFAPEHWAVAVDVPVSGEASFGNDFEAAVDDLLAATSLGDWPLQPCFYRNRVLRIVARTQTCQPAPAAVRS